jgi:hypothetical protein
MSETNSYNDDFGKAFITRLKLLPFVIAVFVIAYLVNKGLWALNSIAILSVIVALIPIKLVLIVFRFFQLWRVENKKMLLLFFLPIILILAFLFDIGTVPYLWVYGLGEETQGKAVEFIKTSKSRFVRYEYSVGNVTFRKQQDTSVPYFESLSPGSIVNVKYSPDNPKISFLVDVEYLKNQTTFTLFLGFGIMVAMFASDIQEKVSSLVKNRFGAKKPA